MIDMVTGWLRITEVLCFNLEYVLQGNFESIDKSYTKASLLKDC